MDLSFFDFLYKIHEVIKLFEMLFTALEVAIEQKTSQISEDSPRLLEDAYLPENRRNSMKSE